MRDMIRERSEFVLDIALDGLSDGEKQSLAKTLDVINDNLLRSSAQFEAEEILSPARAAPASAR